jgi:AraC-like DNA-binding protein
MEITVMEIVVAGLQVGIVFQSLMFIVYLLTDRRLEVIANRINFALLSILAIHMLFNLLNKHLLQLALSNVVFGFGLFYGPLIYFYIKALIYNDFTWRDRYWLHFLPALVLSAGAMFTHVEGYVGAILTFLSMGAYLLTSLWAYWRFRQVVSQTQSADDLITMNWVAVVLGLNASAILFNIINFSLSILTSTTSLVIWSEISLFFVLLVLVNAFLFKGLTQPALFAGISFEDEVIESESRKKLALTSLDIEIRTRIESKLLVHMQQKKPYLDPMFSLQTLGRQLGETPRYVSLVINHQLQLNFSDFVNNYRLTEVKVYMSDKSDKRSILELIYACGFSTKSNFNRAFKKHEGITPSQYRQRQLENN